MQSSCGKNNTIKIFIYLLILFFSLCRLARLGQMERALAVSVKLVDLPRDIPPANLLEWMAASLKDPGSIPGGDRRGSMIPSTLCSTWSGSAFHARQTLIWPRI